MSNQSRENYINNLRNYLHGYERDQENNTDNDHSNIQIRSTGSNSAVLNPNPSFLFFMSFLDPERTLNNHSHVSLSDYTLRIRLNTGNLENNTPQMEEQNNERTNEDNPQINQIQNNRNVFDEVNILMRRDTAVSTEVDEENVNNEIEGQLLPTFRHFRVRSEQERIAYNPRLPYVIVFDIVRNNTTISIEFHSDEITVMDNLSWLGEFNANFAAANFRNVCNLQKLKKLKVRRITKKEKKTDCSICLNLFKHREMARTLPCKHMFHKKCVDKWLLNQSDACPICRKVVEG
ncbi:hypothetical protein NGRA_3463 [Nosema granulosis]|uniref:RING-type domain-containing protein n=1 Tax=Nosema granulosis TaxID=83296 RepID=A0A9P6KX53_9MICR|nr:hypothetical protein NGRA_3463 [Nosema granulosis]